MCVCAGVCVCVCVCTWSVCVHGVGILLSHKKELNFAICSNMDRAGGHYAKWNKSEKDKYYMVSLICGIQKIKQTSEYNKKGAYPQTKRTN